MNILVDQQLKTITPLGMYTYTDINPKAEVMKKIGLVAGVLIISTMMVSGQTGNLQKKKQENNVVVNHKMIDRFNKAEFNKNSVTYRYLERNYSMDEIKVFYHAYHQSNLDLSDVTKIDYTLIKLKAMINNPNESIRRDVTLYSVN